MSAARPSGRGGRGRAAPPRGSIATRARDAIAALRPRLWIPAIALFEAGRTLPTPGTGDSSVATAISWPTLEAWPALVSLLALLGAVHVGNAWRDRESDRVNRKGGAIASGSMAGGEAALLAGTCLAVALAAAAVVPGPARLLLLAAAGLGFLYVVPPFEAKRRPGLDLATQAAGYGVVAFLIGAEAGGRLGPGTWLRSIPYASGIASVSLLTMIADRKGDRAAGQRTLAVRLGLRGSHEAAIGLAVVTAAGGLLLSDAVPALWGVVAAAWLSLGSRAAPDRPSGSWIRDAVLLQLALLALLAPCTPFPLVVSLALGGPAMLEARRRSGTRDSRDTIGETREKAARSAEGYFSRRV
jgi:4-hydroxybenzoate polyprenyltransferase